MRASKSSKMVSEFQVEIAKRVQYAMPEMHYHDYFEIYIEDEGVRDSVVSKKNYSLSPRDVLLIKPNILHQFTGDGTYTRTNVYFTEKYLHKYFSEELCGKILAVFDFVHLTLSVENYYKVSKIVREMRMEESKAYGSITFTKVAELLTVFLINVKERPPELIPENERIVSSSSPMVSYVHENYLSLNNIEEIASTFYITPSHLCRTFKKTTGYTITQYINILKVQQACHLLKDEKKPITEIALDCGFNSTMYFCKIFKKILNISPTEYRKL